MFIVNGEGAIRKNDKWLMIERSKKGEHGMVSFHPFETNRREGSIRLMQLLVNMVYEAFKKYGGAFR